MSSAMVRNCVHFSSDKAPVRMLHPSGCWRHLYQSQHHGAAALLVAECSENCQFSTMFNNTIRHMYVYILCSIHHILYKIVYDVYGTYICISICITAKPPCPNTLFTTASTASMYLSRFCNISTSCTVTMHNTNRNPSQLCPPQDSNDHHVVLPGLVPPVP